MVSKECGGSFAVWKICKRFVSAQALHGRQTFFSYLNNTSAGIKEVHSYFIFPSQLNTQRYLLEGFILEPKVIRCSGFLAYNSYCPHYLLLPL